MIFKSHDEAIGYFSELNGKLDFNCINSVEESDEVLKLHKGLVEEVVEAYYDYMFSVYNNPDLQEDTGKISTVLGQIEALARMLSVLRQRVSLASFEKRMAKSEEEPSFDGSFENSIFIAINSDELKDLIRNMRFGSFENVKYVFSRIEESFNDFKTKFSRIMDEFCYFEFVEIVHDWMVEAKLVYKHKRREMLWHLEATGSISKLYIMVEWDDSPFEFDRNLPQEYNSCWDWSYINAQVVKDELTPDTILLTHTPLIEPVLLLETVNNLSCVFRPVEAPLNNILLFGVFAEGVEAIKPIV